MQAIHQFHAGTSTGDAITNDMLEIRAFLRNAGFRSEIFAESVAPKLEKEIAPIERYQGDSSAHLIIHHSMGIDQFDKVAALPDRKVLRYHNITPSRYLPNAHLQAYAEKGRQQLRDYLHVVEFAMGDSEYNCRELREVGYADPAVVPIFFNPDMLLNEKPDHSIIKNLEPTFNLLFTGRICPNKKQDELIRIFAHYHKLRSDSRLLLVGSWQGTEEYATYLREELAGLGLQKAVTLTGKVSLAQLVAYYRASDVFVCASEHEGFCVPLLEAMTFGLPVLACDSTAVPEIVADAGLLLDERGPELWGEIIEELRRAGELREQVLVRQSKRLQRFDLSKAGAKLLQALNGKAEDGSPRPGKRKPTLQIQGPFETSYSLATINRNLALALDNEGSFDVSIYCTEGPGDYNPRESNLADKPQARALWQKSKTLRARPDVVIRNLYPPRVRDAAGKTNFLLFFWEDSLVPQEWVSDFNHSLDAILAPSQHVQQVLRRSGVVIPIHVVSPGVEDRFFARQSSASQGSTPFTFLHISSGFPRKGVDKLLEAYFTEFTASDDVSLIVKTFPNPHNSVASQLQEWRKPGRTPPPCIHIDKDVTEEELDRLYDGADCAVYPSRSEGFGLPIAESMARRLPTIATSYGGHMDFCTGQNSFLLDYKMVPSGSHFNVPGAEWAEPDVGHLRQLMRSCYTQRGSEMLREKVEAAAHDISRFRWEKAAENCVAVCRGYLSGISTRKCTKLAMVTSWDARCGIAEYSRYLLEAVLARSHAIDPVVLSSPGEGIWQNQAIPHQVCWRNRGEGDLQTLQQAVLQSDIDVVHFQFNFGFFELAKLGAAVRDLRRAGKKVIITFHRTADVQENGTVLSLRQIHGALSQANVLLVHSRKDADRLAAFGLRDNVHIIPHGNVIFPIEDRALRSEWGLRVEPVIGTFGFLLPHKGVLELLEAVKMLSREFPDIGMLAQCALHRDPVSRQFEATVRQRIDNLNLGSRAILSTGFLEPEEATLFLQLADIIVLPYNQTPESTSAAVRFALTAGRPVITTACEIFDDVAAATYQISSNAPAEIAAGLRTLLNDATLAKALVERARNHAEAAGWDRVAAQYLQILQGTPDSSKSEHSKVGLVS